MFVLQIRPYLLISDLPVVAELLNSDLKDKAG